MRIRDSGRLVVAALLAMACATAVAQAPPGGEPRPNPKLNLTDEQRAFLREHPVIRVGNEMDWAPFDYVDNDRPAGYSIGLMNLLAQRLGVEIEYVNGMTWSDLVEEFKAKRIDVMPCIYYIESRDAYSLFTDSYHGNTPAIITRRDDASIRSMADLGGKRVAMPRAFTFLEALPREEPTVEMMPVDSLLDALHAVASGEADATVESAAALTHLINEHAVPNLKLATFTEFENYPRKYYALRMAVRDDWPQLRAILNEALRSITPQEKQRLQERWIGDLTGDEKDELVLTESERAWLDEHPVITVAHDADWPPVEFVGTHGRFTGISVDHLAKLGERLGVRFEPAPPRPWTEAIEGVRAGRTDIAASLSPTPEREEWLAFTRPFASYPMVIVTRQDVPYVGGVGTLDGKRAAVVNGYASHELLESNHPDIDLLVVDDVESGLVAVSHGQAFAFVGSMAVVNHVVAREGLTNLRVSGETPYRYELAIAARKDQTMLIGLLDKALASIPQQERAAIHAAWNPLPVEPLVDYTMIWQVGGITLLVLIVVLYWNRRLSALSVEWKRARDAAERANRAKSLFLANMSHELRTPLNAIIGYAEFLKDVARDEQAEEMIPDLEKIAVAGNHLHALVNDVLDISKIEAGRMQLFVEPFSLRGLLDESAETLRPLVERNGNTLALDFADDLGEVHADITKVRQSLYNLVSNAAKFTEAGTVTIKAQRVGRKGGDRIFLSIIDTGEGIPSDRQDEVFEEFRQADESTTRRHGGTGLGLPISRKFCRMMGGDLTVRSAPGHGATFTIELPAIVEVAPEFRRPAPPE